MRRRAVAERLQQEAEALLGAFRREAQSDQHTLLQLHGIDTNGTAADLAAVHDHIIGTGAAIAGVALDHIEILQHGAGEGVVLRHVAPLLLAVLKQRELGDPQKVEGARFDKTELLGEVVAELSQCIVDDLILGVGNDEQQVALLGVQRLVNAGDLLLGEEFLKAGGKTLMRPAGIGKTLGAVGFYKIGELVDLLAGELFGSALGIDATHRAAAGNGAGEYRKAGIFEDLGKIVQLEVKAGIGLIDAVVIHGVLILDAAERRFEILAEDFLEDALHKALVHRHDVLLINEGHLHVDLGEFRLTVGTQVFIAEAAGNLHIAVKAGAHQNLLIKLGGLGQGVEFALLHTAGYQIVTGTLRRRLDENRGLDLQKAVGIVVVAGDLDNTVAHGNGALHFGAAQIEVAILEAQILLDALAVIADGKGRGIAFRQHPQLADIDLHLAGGDLVIDGFAAAQNPARHQNILGAHLLRLCQQFRAGFIIEGKLDDAGTVAQVDEDQCSHIAGFLRPTAHHHFSADHLRGDGAAVMGALQTFHGVCHKFCTPFVLGTMLF